MSAEIRNGPVGDLIRTAAQSGVRLWVENERLCYEAPRGGIPEALHAALRAGRSDIIGLLSRPIFRKRADTPGTLRYPAFWSDFWQETQADPWLRHLTHFALRLCGDISLQRVLAALDMLTLRHDLLRSRIWCDDGIPCLRLVQGGRVYAEVVDLSGEPAPERAARLEELLAGSIYSPFAEDQLYRATVFKASEAEYLIAIVVHHFVIDAFGCQILAGELAASLRDGDCSSSISEKPPLQYSDYLLGIGEWLLGRGPGYRLGFWTEKMRGAPSVRLPAAAMTCSPAAAQAASVKIRVSAALRASVASRAAAHRTPLPTVLLAAKFAALFRILKKTDLVVTVLHWGRDDPALLKLVGFTVNCIPIRVSVRPEMSFVELLSSVNSSYLLAVDYQVPWALLRRSFAEIGASSAAPLFNYMYVGNAPSSSPGPSGAASRLEIEPVAVAVRADLISVDWKTHEFTVVDDAKELLVTVRYIPSTYEPAAASELAGTFLGCLEAIATDPEQSMDSVPITAGAAHA